MYLIHRKDDFAEENLTFSSRSENNFVGLSK